MEAKVEIPDPFAHIVLLGEGRSMTEVRWDGHIVQMYRSKTGRSFRVFTDGVEVTA